MPTLTMGLEWFSQHFFLNYRMFEDEFHRLYRNQIAGLQSLPSYARLAEEGIAKRHPTTPEGEVV